MSVDYPDFATPQAHADAIAATGAPPVIKFNGTANNVVQPGPGAVALTANFAFDQPAYEILLSAFEIGAGAAGPLKIDMRWYEDTGLTFIDQQTYWIWPAIASPQHQVVIKGPTRGALLSMIFTNTSAAMTYQVNYWQYARSHFYERDQAYSVIQSTTSSGLTLPVSDTVSGLLGFRTLLIAGSGNDTTLLPLYTGLVQVYADTSSATTDMTLAIQDSANPNAEGMGTRFYALTSNAAGIIAAQVQLPRYQCQVQMLNGNAAAKTLRYMIHPVD